MGILNHHLRRCSAVFAICSLLCGISLQSGAQSVLQRRDAPEPEYQLGAGDQINVRVSDLEDAPREPVPIDPDGNIDLPLVGTVHAAGLTPAQLRQTLTASYKTYIQNPQVQLNVTNYQSRPVSVLGSVTHAGVYQMQGPKHLAEVISLAGGTSTDAGPNVVVTRKASWGPVTAPGAATTRSAGSSSVSIPLDNITTAKVPEDNILIRPDDVVSIPPAELVYVVGNVRRAGAFSLNHHANITVLQAISLAEGFTPNASAEHARILRRTEHEQTPREIKIDASSILAGKSPDEPLMANDILFIPNSAWKASSKRALDAAIGLSTGVLVYRR